MTDRIQVSLEQVRDDKPIFDLAANWFELEDWAANQMAMQLVGGVIQLAAEWDKALTGGVPAKK